MQTLDTKVASTIQREKFENAVLSLRLGLPSTLIRHEKRSFSKTLFKPEEFENAAFRFSLDGKHFENGAFRKRWHHDNHVIFQN